MNFLKYIELSAENLQFYLWFRDYSKRFSALPDGEMILSPGWTGDSTSHAEVKTASKLVNTDAAAMLRGTDFASDTNTNGLEKGGSNPFFTPPRTPTSFDRRDAGESLDSYDDSMAPNNKVDHNSRAAGAFENAGLKWKPRKSC